MNRVYHQEVKVTKRRRSSSKLVLVFILLLLVALAVTNPKKEDFTEYLVSGSFESAESGVLKNLVNSVGNSLLNSVTERDNYIFLSVYYYGDGNDGPKYIGFFKRIFIEI